MNDDEKEVLKVGAQAALRPFADLIEKLFGGASEQIGGMWEDSLAVQRQIRRLHLFKKLKAIIENAGFEPQRITFIGRFWVTPEAKNLVIVINLQ